MILDVDFIINEINNRKGVKVYVIFKDVFVVGYWGILEELIRFLEIVIKV